MREKLIELLENIDYVFGDTRDRYSRRSVIEFTADYLLENGVVVLPCELDDVYKIKVYYKHHIKNKYAVVRYDCQQGKPYKIVAYNIQGKELMNNEDLIVYHYLPSTNFTVIANGFDTKEEAEKTLERSKQ